MTATNVSASPLVTRRLVFSISLASPDTGTRARYSGHAAAPTRNVARQAHASAASASHIDSHSSHAGAAEPPDSTPQRPMKPRTASWTPCQPRAEVRSSVSRSSV